MARLAPAALLFAIALVLLFLGCRKLLNLKAVSKWPAVSGIITAAEFKDISHDVHATIFRPSLSYLYIFNGEQFTSTRLGIDEDGFDHFSKVSIRKFMDSTAVGSTVRIHVNPSQPSQGILAPGASAQRRSHYLAQIVSGILLSVCAYGILALSA